jgi:glutamyl/glutaminyl-tRNA synthetase
MKKQIQKRYYYASFLASLFFIICYGILDFDLFIVLILTTITFIGSVYFFREKDVRKYDPKIIQTYYFGISKIANYTNLIKDENITSQIKQITFLTEQILGKISERPHKVEQVYDFCDYYLNITYKILRQYHRVDIREEKSKKESEFIKKTPHYLEALIKLFNQQNKNMNEEVMVDVNSSIRVFEKTMGIDKMDVLMEMGEDSEY